MCKSICCKSRFLENPSNLSKMSTKCQKVIKFETNCQKDYTIYWDFKNIIAPFEYYAIGELHV